MCIIKVQNFYSMTSLTSSKVNKHLHGEVVGKDLRSPRTYLKRRPLNVTVRKSSAHKRLSQAEDTLLYLLRFAYYHYACSF